MLTTRQKSAIFCGTLLLVIGTSSCVLEQTVPYTPAQIRDLSVPVDIKPEQVNLLTWDQRQAVAERARLIGYYSDPTNCREALQRDPDDAEAHLRLGVSAIDTAPSEAVKHLQTSVRVRPNDRHAALMLGLALKRNGQKEEAAAIWKRLARQQDSAGVAAQKALKKL